MIYIKRLIAVIIASLITIASMVLVLVNNCFFVTSGKSLKIIVEMNNDIVMLFTYLKDWANQE